MTAPAAELAGITWRPDGLVLNDVHFTLGAGEVHALAGENGAGKSSLMRVLAGVITPHAGHVHIGGAPLAPHRPERAIALGVGMVYQHFMLVGPATVAENVALGREPRRHGLFDRRAAEAEVEALSARFGLEVDPRARVDALPVGVQQRVELLKVLARDARVVVLDEPTAILTPREVDELLEIIRKLRAAGRGVVLISHKLRELLAVADRITILRRGRVATTVDAASTTAEALSAAMIGHAVDAPVRTPRAHAGRAARLVVDRLVVARPGAAVGSPPIVDGVSLQVHAGELVGVAGVEGNGQSELVEAITGIRAPSAGTITLDGQVLRAGDVAERFELGLAHVPADRHAHAVRLDASVAENAALGREARFTWLGHLRRGLLRADAEALVQAADVRPPDVTREVGTLSGGNQQKLVIARALSGEPCVVVAAHPTRGLDVGAMAEVDRRLLDARDRGAAVLVVSAELAELRAIADVIHVMYRGRLVWSGPAEAADERTLGLAMAGVVDAAPAADAASEVTS
jgi:ABC-type uncharacterized transport system ATPase subunit